MISSSGYPARFSSFLLAQQCQMETRGFLGTDIQILHEDLHRWRSSRGIYKDSSLSVALTQREIEFSRHSGQIIFEIVRFISFFFVFSPPPFSISLMTRDSLHNVNLTGREQRILFICFYCPFCLSYRNYRFFFPFLHFAYRTVLDILSFDLSREMRFLNIEVLRVRTIGV